MSKAEFEETETETEPDASETPDPEAEKRALQRDIRRVNTGILVRIALLVACVGLHLWLRTGDPAWRFVLLLWGIIAVVGLAWWVSPRQGSSCPTALGSAAGGPWGTCSPLPHRYPRQSGDIPRRGNGGSGDRGPNPGDFGKSLSGGAAGPAEGALKRRNRCLQGQRWSPGCLPL